MNNRVLRFIAFTLGLAVFAAIFGVIGALIGGGVIGEVSFGALGLGILGAIILYYVGIIVGLIMIRIIFRQHGSIILGGLGAVAAFVILWVIAFAWESIIPVLFPVMSIAIPAVSLAGFYLKR